MTSLSELRLTEKLIHLYQDLLQSSSDFEFYVARYQQDLEDSDKYNKELLDFQAHVQSNVETTDQLLRSHDFDYIKNTIIIHSTPSTELNKPSILKSLERANATKSAIERTLTEIGTTREFERGQTLRRRISIILLAVAIILTLIAGTALTRNLQEMLTSQANETATQQAFINATATKGANETATQQVFINATATKGANETATQQVFINATATKGANETATQQAFINATTTQSAHETATQQAFINATATKGANETATQQAFINTTATKGANETATQQAFINTTATQEAHETATQQAFINATTTQQAHETATQQTFVDATLTQQTFINTTATQQANETATQRASITDTPTRTIATNTPYPTPWRLTTTDNTNIRQYPYSVSAIMGSLLFNQTVTVIDQVEGETIFGSNVWYQVEHGNKTGYIHSALLRE